MPELARLLDLAGSALKAAGAGAAAASLAVAALPLAPPAAGAAFVEIRAGGLAG